MQVVGFHLITAGEGGMGAGHSHGVELRAVTLDAAADGFIHEVLDLFAADLHIRQPLAGQQQLGCEGVGFFRPGCREGAAALSMADHRVGDLHPLFGAHQLIGREGNGKAVQQVIANVAFFRVVGGNQQGAARVAEAEAFALHPVFAAAYRRQHQVDDAVVQQVELIDIENTAVGIRQQAGLEDRTTAGQ